jgi:hypothetical protein
MFHSPPRAYLLYLAIGVAVAIGSRAPDDWVEPAANEADAPSAPPPSPAAEAGI